MNITSSNKQGNYKADYEMLTMLDIDMHTSYFEDSSKKIKPILEGGYRDIGGLIGVERFFDRVVATKDKAFEEVKDDDGNVVDLISNPLSKELKNMNTYLSLAYLSDSYVLSEKAIVFFEAVDELGALSDFLFESVFIRVKGLKVINQTYKALNRLIDTVREKGTEVEFKRRSRAREKQSRNNNFSCKRYINNMFDVFSRLLVVRVDLAYLKNCFELISPEIAIKDRERLLNNMRSNEIFKDCVGYIWKLEYGHLKGFHYHFIFFFNGATRHKGGFIADQIGAYWSNKITKSKGVYHNCNRANYKKDGIGMIDRTNGCKRDCLVDVVVAYLMKQDQYIMAKLPNMRTFGKGVVPKKKVTGRPRINKYLTDS